MSEGPRPKRGQATGRPPFATQRASSMRFVDLPPHPFLSKRQNNHISKAFKCRFSFFVTSVSPPSGEVEGFSASLPFIFRLYVHSLYNPSFPTHIYTHTIILFSSVCVPIMKINLNKTPTPSSPPPTIPTTPSSPSTYNAPEEAFHAAAPAPVPPPHSQAALACAALSP